MFGEQSQQIQNLFKGKDQYVENLLNESFIIGGLSDHDWLNAPFPIVNLHSNRDTHDRFTNLLRFVMMLPSKTASAFHCTN